MERGSQLGLLTNTSKTNLQHDAETPEQSERHRLIGSLTAIIAILDGQ